MSNILTIHTRHDANLSVSDGKKIILYLELEKVAKKRYFTFDNNPKRFKRQFQDLAMPFLKDKDISMIVLCWVDSQQEKILREIFPNVKDWKYLNHHISHVWSAYMFTDPIESDLILSYDGGGDLDDSFKIYYYKDGKINLLLDAKINLGKPYRLLGLLSPELYRDQNKGYLQDRPLSGKIMALVSLGKVRKEYIKPIEKFYRDFSIYSLEENFKLLIKRIGFKNEKFLPQKIARDLLATSQFFFENTVKRYLYPFLDEGNYKRLIIVGGCALNVTTNSMISERYGIPIFIPPCPNDCGISLGMQKIVNLKIKKMTSPFFEINPTNKDLISHYKIRFNSKRINLSQLANLLFSGKIVGTVTGPLEIGPRALGNRSYLANPFIPGIKDRLNRLKGREYWRPVAPIIPRDKLNIFFETNQDSPYMTFAPKVRNQYRKLLKEVTHYDGTSRIQTIVPADGWIFDLLKEFGKRSGKPILMNTSFNIKGEPLINDYKDAFKLLEETDLDGIYIDGYYYGK